jgi:hypothetical protein
VYVGAIADPILDAPPKNPIVAISCCPQELGQPLILIVESLKLSSVSNSNSKSLRCTSFANLWEFVIARLQEVVPEHPTADAIVNAPGFASPIDASLL